MNTKLQSGKRPSAVIPGLGVTTGLRAGGDHIKSSCNTCITNCAFAKDGQPWVDGKYEYIAPDGSLVQDDQSACLSECDLIC